jgi:hypothetical protein
VNRALLRTILGWVKYPALVLVALNIERLAQDNQWDSVLSENWRAAVNNVLVALQSGWVQYPAAFLLGATFFLWVDGILRRKESNAPTAEPSSAGGDTARIIGTVNDPPSFDEKGLYVGRMQISEHQLAEKRTLEISAFCFNATGHAIRVARVDGTISVKEAGIEDPKTFQLPHPWLETKDQSPEQSQIKHGSEFQILLEQRVAPELADKILEAKGQHAFHFELKQLNISIVTLDGKNTKRMPLWDGITLSRKDHYLLSGRIISMVVGPAQLRIGT